MRRFLPMPVVLLAASALAADAPTTPDPDTTAGERARAVLGAHVGAAIPFTALRPAVTSLWEVGYQPRGLAGTLRVGIAGAWASHDASGMGTDPRVPDEQWSWTLRQQVLLFAPTATVRYARGNPRFVPELTLGPTLTLLRSRIDGASGGAPFGTSKERLVRPGLLASVALAARIDVVEIVASARLTTSSLNGDVTGRSHSTSLAPSIGARLVL